MPIDDLENAIRLPNGVDTANDNPIAVAEKVVVTGTGNSVTTELNAREGSLGNPTADGQVLSSLIDGTRSWVTGGGGTDDFVNSATYSDNVLTLGRSGALADLTVTIPEGESLERMTNRTGSTIPAGQPVVLEAHTDGSFNMLRASPSRVGHSNGPGVPENFIYGFVTEDVLNGAVSRPVRSGRIDGVQLNAGNNAPGQILGIGLVGGIYVLTDASFTDSDDYSQFAGIAISPEDTSSVDNVFVSLDWVEQDLASRLASTVEGKEDALGNPGTDGQLLSSTAAGVRSWVDAGSGGMGFVDVNGTPVVDQVAFFTDADTIEGRSSIPADIIQFSPIPLAQGTILTIDTQGEYNTYRNQEIVVTPTVGNPNVTDVTLPTLGTRQSWYRTGDVFTLTHSADTASTAAVALRVVNASDSIPGFPNGVVSLRTPGSSISVRVPAVGRVWEVVSFGSSGDISGGASGSDDGPGVMSETPSPIFPINNHWNENVAGALEHRGPIHIADSLVTVAENVIDHLTNPADTNNPVELLFDDDQSMVAWWRHVLPNQSELQTGDHYNTILTNTASAVTWIDSNIGVGFNFQLNSPDADKLDITEIAYESGTSLRAHVGTGVANLTTIPGFTVGRRVFIEGSGLGIANGEHILLAVTSSHFTFSVAGAGPTTNDPVESAATASLVWYGDVVVANATSRQYNFNLYYNSARTAAITFDPDYFDPAADIGAVNSAVDIEFTAAREDVPNATIETHMGNILPLKYGSKDAVFYYRNVLPDYSSTISLPGDYRYLYVETDGIIISGRINITTDVMQDGDARVITVVTGPGGSSHHYSFNFYNPFTATAETFDSGYAFFNIEPENQVTFLLYRNSETDRGIRVISAIERTKVWAPYHTTPVTASAGNINPLPMQITNLITAQDEDSGSTFGILDHFGGVPDDTYRIIRGADFTFEYNVDIRFNGAEGTGLLFVPVQLTPHVNGVAQTGSRSEGTLLFSRNGQAGSGAPKFSLSLNSVFHWSGSNNDDVDFRLTFGTFPTGYTQADIQIQDATPRITIKLGQG